MEEKNLDISGAEAKHARALELRERLASQLDEVGFKRIEAVVNDAVMGKYRTERTEAKKADRMNKTREDVRDLMDARSRKTDAEVLEEVLVKTKEMGIVGDEVKRFMGELTEYAILMNQLNLTRN